MPRLILVLATTQEEIYEVQRLRYQVFTETFHLSALKNPEGLNVDEVDACCDHLIVRVLKHHVYWGLVV